VPTLAATSPEAIAYLDEALSSIQTLYYLRDQVDWEATRQTALTAIAGAQVPADVHETIQDTIRLIGDNHGHIIPPIDVSTVQQGQLDSQGYFLVYPERVVLKVYADSPAAKAGIREGDLIEAIDGVPTSTMTETLFFDSAFGERTINLTLRRAGENAPIETSVSPGTFGLILYPTARRLEENIGYLEVPNASNGQDLSGFAQRAHDQIAAVDADATCGWIVDLRRNTGGSALPMLLAIGPIVGEGTLGAFVVGEQQTNWIYQTGTAQTGSRTLTITEPYTLKRANLPVAVLTADFTNSGGEITAISFRNRPPTRSFGEPTGGSATTLDGRQLSDGALLRVSTGVYADRSGQSYADPIPPDQPVDIDWTLFGRDDDPVIKAASEWLRQQPTCTAN
jgi:C-terminal processing protease CtpA/Prc